MPRPSEPDLARLYHLNSSNVRARTVPMTVDWDAHPPRARTYPGAARFDLPGRDLALAGTLGEHLAARHSVRMFRRGPVPLEALGRLLHAAGGVRGFVPIGTDGFYDRPAPSAGGLYPLELYAATQDIDGLPDGVYHYDPDAHQLEQRRQGRVQPDLAKMTLGQEMLADAAIVVVICGVFARTMWKYGPRGYRYVWLEAGHVGQNLCLAAGALGLGATPVGGFFDAEVGRLLDIPDGEEDALYLLCAGPPAGGPDGDRGLGGAG